MFTANLLKSHYTKCEHGVGNFFEARDICASHIVAIATFRLPIFEAAAVNAIHDIDQQLLGLVQRMLAQSFANEPVCIRVSGGGAQPWLRLLPKPCELMPDLLFQGMLRYIELSGL